MRPCLGRLMTAALLLQAFVNTGCRSQKVEESKVASPAFAVVTVSVIQWLLDKALEIPVQKKIEDILDGVQGMDHAISNEESAFSKALASNLEVSLDQAMQRDITIKLNALEASLTHDYIPGLAEASTQLTLMNEKANDIRSAIETLAADKSDLNHLGMAIANHRSYMLASSMKLFVQAERLKLAKASLGEKAGPTLELQKSLESLANQTRYFLDQFETDFIDTYAKARLLTYEYQTKEESESFGFQQNIRFARCVKVKAKPDQCGPWSQQVCANELATECVANAQKEAVQALASAGIEKTLLDDLRRGILDGSIKTTSEKITRFTRHK